MAKWIALDRLTILPSTTIQPGETVELGDREAVILLRKGCIKPAIVMRTIIFANDLEEYEHGTND